MKDLEIDWNKMGGLVPAIVQDASTLQVLMLGYMNEESLQKTIDTRKVTFFSRSKNALWTKGETSGHTLELEHIEVDCDNDALLIMATPQGPTCHRNTTSCFGEATAPGVGFLAHLERVIASREQERPKDSYTTSLFEAGASRIAQKVGEEGVETALAVATGADNVLDEAADLVFHLLVALRARGKTTQQLFEVLGARHR